MHEPFLLSTTPLIMGFSKEQAVSSCNKAGLLVPLLCIHDLIDDVSLWPHNSIDYTILYGILRLHVQRPLHVLHQQQIINVAYGSVQGSANSLSKLGANSKSSKGFMGQDTHVIKLFGGVACCLGQYPQEGLLLSEDFLPLDLDLNCLSLSSWWNARLLQHC